MLGPAILFDAVASVQPKTVGLTQAKRSFEELVERASGGERMGMIKRGKLMAVIRLAQEQSDLKDIFEGMERIRKCAKPLRGVTTKGLLEKGAQMTQPGIGPAAKAEVTPFK